MEKKEFQRVVSMIRGADDSTNLMIIGPPRVRERFVADIRQFDPKLADHIQQTIDAREALIAHVRSKT